MKDNHRLEKIVLDPLDRKGEENTLSREEAREIYEAGFPTFEEMLEGAQKRFPLPQSAWEPFYQVLEERKNPAKSCLYRWRNTGLSVRSGVLRHKSLAVACVILLMLASFFTLVPAGQALAREGLRWSVEWMGNVLEISRSGSVSYDGEGGRIYAPEVLYPHDTVTMEFDTVSRLQRETGYTPVQVRADWLSLVRIKFQDIDREGITVLSFYETADGGKVYLTQKWDAPDMTLVENAIFRKAEILGGVPVYYAVDTLDATFAGVAVVGDSILMIGAPDEGTGLLLLEALR